MNTSTRLAPYVEELQGHFSMDAILVIDDYYDGEIPYSPSEVRELFAEMGASSLADIFMFDLKDPMNVLLCEMEDLLEENVGNVDLIGKTAQGSFVIRHG